MPVPLTAWAAKRSPAEWLERPSGDAAGAARTELGNVPTGAQLRARREALGLTQYDVAAAINAIGMRWGSPYPARAKHIREIEHGHRASLGARQAYSDALGALAAHPTAAPSAPSATRRVTRVTPARHAASTPGVGQSTG
jgi:hypothetical protein